MAALEAQAAGLPCLLSASVPRETKLTRNVEFIPAEDPAIWAEHMLNMLERHEIRRDEAQTIADAGYDIGTAAQRLEDKLIALTERKRFQRRFLMSPKTSASGVPALNKARADIEQIAAEMGYAPFVLHAPDSANGSVWQAIQVGAKTLGDWVRAFCRMRQGDLLLVQYPYFPVKGYGVARLALHLLRWKGVKTVHDLDSLRRIGGSAARGSDQLLLPGFEALIVHSQRMESYLRTQGVTCPMILMEAFDCLSEGEIPVREKSRMVAIAGNLAADKSGYLKDIGKVPLEWQLYGTNWAGSDSTRIEYHGEIAPEKLPETISGAFGIVWDGDSLDGLTGLYGAYALLNSPHKLSTYLAGGLPVIVAKNAAAADFVAREQVGVALNSLRELPELIRTMPEEDYQRYAANARRVGTRLRAGENTKRVLRKLEEVE